MSATQAKRGRPRSEPDELASTRVAGVAVTDAAVDLVAKSVVVIGERADHLLDTRGSVWRELAQNPRKAQLVVERLRGAARALEQVADAIEKAGRA